MHSTLKFAPAKVNVEKRADGSFLVRSPQKLGPYARCVTEWLSDWSDRAPERALFHLYNLMRERDGSLLLTSALPPAHWSIALPDLASRLRAAPAVALAPPDDELLGSIILKQLGDRQLHAGAGVVQYLVSHMERSAEAARRVVAALDRRGLIEKREIDRRLAADVLGELSGMPPTT